MDADEEMARRVAAAIISVEEGLTMAAAYKRIKAEVLKPEWMNVCVVVYERTVCSSIADPFFEHNTEFLNPRIIIGAEERNAAAKNEAYSSQLFANFCDRNR